MVTPGHRFEQSADQWFLVNFLTLGRGAWIWLTIGFIGTVVIVIGSSARRRPPGGPGGGRRGGPARASRPCVQTWRVVWDNDKDFARYYAQSTVFYAPATSGADAPPSLDRLIAGARPGTGGCALAGAADVASCVKAGTLPVSGWNARISSFNGAVYALSRSSGDIQNVSLNAATVHYLNAWHGQPDGWSGILDGNGISQGMGGVAEWNGSKVTTCTFSGRYAIDRSFSGTNMADLPDYLAQQLPGPAVDDRRRLGLLRRQPAGRGHPGDQGRPVHEPEREHRGRSHPGPRGQRQDVAELPAHGASPASCPARRTRSPWCRRSSPRPPGRPGAGR